MSETTGAQGRGVISEIGQSLRSNPAFARLGGEAKKYAFAKAGQVVENLTGRLQEAGQGGNLKAALKGAQGLAQGQSPARAGVGAAMTALKEKVKSAFSRKKKGSGGQVKMTNIEESIDIGLPVDQVYNQWSQFEEFSKFMKGVEGVERTSDTETNWRVKVFKSRRTWKGTIQEMVPDRRIVWTSEGAKGSTKGVVTFHPLADDLTRVLLAMEYYPSGFMEKVGNIWRAGGRRARLDLKHFRRHLMFQGEQEEGWRGEIRDGQVVRQPDEGGSGEGQEGLQEPRDERQDQGQPGEARDQWQDRDENADQQDRDSGGEQGDEYDEEHDSYDEQPDGQEDYEDSDQQDEYADEDSEDQEPQPQAAGGGRGGNGGGRRPQPAGRGSNR